MRLRCEMRRCPSFAKERKFRGSFNHCPNAAFTELKRHGLLTVRCAVCCAPVVREPRHRQGCGSVVRFRRMVVRIPRLPSAWPMRHVRLFFSLCATLILSSAFQLPETSLDAAEQPPCTQVHSDFQHVRVDSACPALTSCFRITPRDRSTAAFVYASAHPCNILRKSTTRMHTWIEPYLSSRYLINGSNDF